MTDPVRSTTSPDSPVLLTALVDGVLTITLNRPAVLNALTRPLMAALAEALAAARTGAVDGQVRALVITGAGRGFCAGADLAATIDGGGRPVDLGALLREAFNPVIEQIRTLPLPVIAAVNGMAAGAGMSLALAADLIVAGESARFNQVFARIGVIPDAGSTWFLPRLVGDHRARALAMLTETLSAVEAREIGLVWRVCPDADLATEVATMASRLASQPTRAFALTKQALNASSVHTLAEQLELEASLQHEAGLTADHQEGVTAFLEKRPARFIGR